VGKTVNNVGGLACILGLTNLQNPSLVSCLPLLSFLSPLCMCGLRLFLYPFLGLAVHLLSVVEGLARMRIARRASRFTIVLGTVTAWKTLGYLGAFPTLVGGHNSLSATFLGS